MSRVSVTNLHLNFPMHNSASRSLQLDIFQKLGGRIAREDKTMQVEALRGVNFELVDGDRLALVGHNGAGKTTLLKVLAGVYPPTHGRVEIEGSLTPLTDLSLGMDPESTGYENIIFRCIFIGMTFREARENMDIIAEFSGLGEFLKMPVRTYSTGMAMRLAFAISTSIEPDILILDEMWNDFGAKVDNGFAEIGNKIKNVWFENIYRRISDIAWWIFNLLVKCLYDMRRVYFKYAA